MPRRVPQELINLIVRAGFPTLAAWGRAAGVPVKTLYQVRARGRRPTDRIVVALLGAAERPIDLEELASAIVAKEAAWTH